MPSDRPHLLFRPESVSRSLGFYIPATVVARVLGLARGVILARLLSEHEFGLFQVTLLVVNVLNPLCGFGLTEGITRYVPMYESRGMLRSYLRRTLPFAGIVALVLSAVLFAAAQPLGRAIYETLPGAGTRAAAPETWTALTRVASAATFGTVVYFLLLAILKGLRMFRAVSLMELLNNTVFTLLTVATALSGWKTAQAMMLGYGATLAGVILLFAVPLGRAVSDEPASTGSPEPRSEGLLGQLVRFSAWAAVAAVVWQVLQYYPMWFLQKTHGPALTAVFGGVRLITQVVAVGAVTIVAVIQTAVTKIWESQGREEADRLLRLAYKSTSLLMLAGCVLFAAAAEPIMKLFPASYAIGVRIVPLSLMFFLISSHLTFLAIHFALIERMRHLFWPWMLGLASNVFFGFWLVSPQAPAADALVGAAWAGNLAISVALLTAVLLLWCEKRPIDRGTVVFWISIYILTLPALVAGGLLLLLILMIVLTDWVLAANEKRDVVAYVARARSFLDDLKRGRFTTGRRP